VARCLDQSVHLSTLTWHEGAKGETKTRCRKCGERYQIMKAGIAKFNANQMPNIASSRAMSGPLNGCPR
jgi:hypothetical protein